MTDAEAFLAARDFLLERRTAYGSAYADFRWPALERFNWALDYFDVMARGNGRPALRIVDDGERETTLSFAEVSARSNRIANFLRGVGVARGDRVLVMLGNEVALWETMLAAIKLGSVIIPATGLLSADDLRDRLERGQVRHVVVGAPHASKFDALPGTYTRVCVGGAAAGWARFEDGYGASPEFVAQDETSAGDPMLLYFTSGTTAKPKLVLHSQRSYAVGHLSTMYWIGVRPGDVHWNISSPGWAKHAWSCFFAPWNAGATVFVQDSARFDAGRILRALVRCQVTTLCAPPTVWRLLIQEDLAAHRVGLREALSAGEPLNPEVIERVRRAWNLTVRDGFGQTETTALVGNSPGQPVKPGSMGRPLPGWRVVLLGPAGQPAEEGEICLDLASRPVGLMLGYAGDADKTGEVLRAGHYHTGDVATRDADGYLTYVGRADDVFKASDYRISPFELESVLVEHPAVGEAAVVPSPDPLRLAVPKAFVSLTAGQTPTPALARDIFAFSRTRLAPYKRIRRLEFADLPKTISGKIRRAELRRAEQARGPGRRGELEHFEEDFPDLRG